MSKLIAEIEYRDDVSADKQWGTQAVIVTMELRRGDGALIYRGHANEQSAISWSPLDLLVRFLKQITVTG